MASGQQVQGRPYVASGTKSLCLFIHEGHSLATLTAVRYNKDPKIEHSLVVKEWEGRADRAVGKEGGRGVFETCSSWISATHCLGPLFSISLSGQISIFPL